MRVNAAPRSGASASPRSRTSPPAGSPRRSMLEEFLDRAARSSTPRRSVFSRRRRPGGPDGPVRGLARADRVRRAPAVRRQEHLDRRLPGRPSGHRHRRALVAPGEEGGRAVPAGGSWHGDHPGRIRRAPGARLGCGSARPRRRAADPGRRAGPASVKLLLGFACRLGISTSATIAKKYGLSVTNLLGKAGPENFIRDLQTSLDPDKHGVVKLHFYTFGGFKTTAEWIADHAKDF